mgnify:CR=1 FL=1
MDALILSAGMGKRLEKLTKNSPKTLLHINGKSMIQQIIEKNFITLNIDMNLGDVIHEGVIKSSRNLFPVIDENRNFLGIILLDDIRPIMFDQKMYDDVREVPISRAIKFGTWS